MMTQPKRRKASVIDKTTAINAAVVRDFYL